MSGKPLKYADILLTLHSIEGAATCLGAEQDDIIT